MSLTNCRFYEDKYPEVESFVMVNVKQIAEMGAYVKLLEYGALPSGRVWTTDKLLVGIWETWSNLSQTTSTV